MLSARELPSTALATVLVELNLVTTAVGPFVGGRA
jgi:hypothetical protein